MKIGLLSYRSNPFSGGQGIYVRHLSSALVMSHTEAAINKPIEAVVSVIDSDWYETITERTNFNGKGSMRTSDEMLQFIINYLPYKHGDENIELTP